MDRGKLWNKISIYGIRGKLRNIVTSLYINIRYCVLLDDKLSEFFVDYIGVLQEEIISLLTLYLYFNDCEMEFLSDRNTLEIY